MSSTDPTIPQARAAPELAVSAAIFRPDNKLLLVRRARAPAHGLWTLPGGRVEYGERLVDALMREVLEETGLRIAVTGLAGYREIILGAPVGDRGGHFVILPFAARWISGDVVLNDELSDARWCAIDEAADLPTTEGLADILAAAAALAGL